VSELLKGLGFARASWWNRTWIILLIGLATTLFVVAAHGASQVLGLPILLIHGALWVVWLVWLGVVFPRSRQAWLRGLGPSAFRSAFYVEILPGIGCSFAQIARPTFEGLAHGTHEGTAGLVIGAVVVGVGATLIALGVRRLGIAGTLFVREYGAHPPLLERDGVFREIRHPLFVGGAVLAFGGALMVGGWLPVLLATINLLVIPVYVHFEDARCDQVFGSDYHGYRRDVAAVVPGRRERQQLWRRVAGFRARVHS
jgi:protein-S-isoprenylcysteine O-methyltransferase Ste14